MLTHIANSLNSSNYLLSLPIVLLMLFAVGILLIDLITPPEWKWMNSVTALAGVLFAAAGVMRIQFIQSQLGNSGRRIEWAFGHSMMLDHFSIFFYYLFLISAAITIVISVRHNGGDQQNARFYAFILLSVVGMMCMAAGFDIVLIFVGLEVMTVTTYILTGCVGQGLSSRQSTLKCFMRGTFSSAVLACGFSLLYGFTGNTNLQMIAQGMRSMPPHSGVISHGVVTLALAVTAIGLFSKIAAMPFHQWFLNAFDSAPGSILGLIAVAVQLASWAMLLRIFLWGLYSLRAQYVPMLIFVSVLSIVWASGAALIQTELRRFMAYSSIAHAGYMILGLIALASVEYPAPAFFEGFKGILMYLLAYTFMTLGAFAVIASLRPQKAIPQQNKDRIGDEAENQAEGQRDNRQEDGIEQIAGLFFSAPARAIFMLLFLASLSGLPAFAGFYGKYFIFHSLLAGGHYILAALAIACSIVAIYYYGRLAQVMFLRHSTETMDMPIGIPMWTALGTMAIPTLVIGIYPGPFIRIVEWSLRLT